MDNIYFGFDQGKWEFDQGKWETMFTDFHGTSPEEPETILHKVREGRWFDTTEEYQRFLIEQKRKQKYWAALNKIPTEDAIIISETFNNITHQYKQ